MLVKTKTLSPFEYDEQKNSLGDCENFFLGDKNVTNFSEIKGKNAESFPTPAAAPQKSDHDGTHSGSDGPHKALKLTLKKVKKLDKNGYIKYQYQCKSTLVSPDDIYPSSILSIQPINPNILNRNPSGRFSLLIPARPQEPPIIVCKSRKKPKSSHQEQPQSESGPAQGQGQRSLPILTRERGSRSKVTLSASLPVLTRYDNKPNKNPREKPSRSPGPPKLSPIKPLPLPPTLKPVRPLPPEGSNGRQRHSNLITCPINEDLYLGSSRSGSIIMNLRERKPKTPPALTRFDSSPSPSSKGFRGQNVSNLPSRNGSSSRYSLRSAEELQKAKDFEKFGSSAALTVSKVNNVNPPKKPPQKRISRKKKRNQKKEPNMKIFARPFSPERVLKYDTKIEFLSHLYLIPVVRKLVTDYDEVVHKGSSPQPSIKPTSILNLVQNHESASSYRLPTTPKSIFNPINDQEESSSLDSGSDSDGSPSLSDVSSSSFVFVSSPSSRSSPSPACLKDNLPTLVNSNDDGKKVNSILSGDQMTRNGNMGSTTTDSEPSKKRFKFDGNALQEVQAQALGTSLEVQQKKKKYTFEKYEIVDMGPIDLDILEIFINQQDTDFFTIRGLIP